MPALRSPLSRSWWSGWRRRLEGVAVAIGALWLTACATPMPPQQLLAPADAAIDRARAVGATRDAPRELYGARVKRERAQFLAEDGDLRGARRCAEEAAVEADVAHARAAAVQAERAAAALEPR